MSAVVQWLRLKATSPAPLAAAAHSAPSAKRARRSRSVKQEPAQSPKPDQWQLPVEQGQRQPQQAAQRAQHAPQQAQQSSQQAQHAAQQGQQGGIAATISKPAPCAAGLCPQLPVPVHGGAACSAADLAAAPLVTAISHGAASAQQEHAYMDALAQLRSNMFEDIAVFAPDELPTAGMGLFAADIHRQAR